MNENLKRKLKKITNVFFKSIKLIVIIEISFMIVWILNIRCDYIIEKKYMTHKLNRIPNVKVANIWGHEDLDLEEISARLIVNDTNEIVLHNLSADVFRYPQKVYISEINGKKLIPFYQDGYRCYLNIGTESIIGKELGIVFNKPEDVIKNIEKIDGFFNNLKTAPELNYFCDSITKEEMYLGIANQKGNDSDPINILFDYEKKMEFSKSLNWKYK